MDYLYNGTRLPKLPEWDEKTYPHALLYADTGGFLKFMCGENLYTKKDPKYDFVLYMHFGAGSANYRLTDGAWEFVGYEDSTQSGSMQVDDTAFGCDALWTNKDILNEDGSVYLVATIPLPIALFESGTWDFNGVQLPYLPTWDMETYPLCIITSGTKGFGFECFPSTKKGVLKSGSPVFVGEIRFLLSDGAWMQTDDRLDGYKAIWANYDLMYWVEGDEYDLYLAASEPVPASTLDSIPVFIGINGVAARFEKIYVGDNSNKATTPLKGYIGDKNGKARLFYSLHSHSYIDSDEYEFDDAVDESQHYYVATCSCGDTITLYEDHEFDSTRVVTDPTCTVGGEQVLVCSKCSKSKTETIPATGHTEIPIAAKSATCTNTGLTSGSKCAVCDEIILTQDIIPAKGHKKKTIPAVPATCTETGLSEGQSCSRCGVILKAQTTTPATGHNLVTTALRCDGQYVWSCTNCKYTELRDFGYEDIVRLDKVHVSVVNYDAVEPTCTTEGKTSGSICTSCGDTLLVQTVIPALGHSMVCIGENSDGTWKWKCSRCGYSQNINSGPPSDLDLVNV